MSYNEWANYNSWNTYLWVTNEEKYYLSMLEHKPFTAASAEKFVKSIMPDGTPDFDDGRFGYLKVDWTEVANAFND